MRGEGERVAKLEGKGERAGWAGRRSQGLNIHGGCEVVVEVRAVMYLVFA